MTITVDRFPEKKIFREITSGKCNRKIINFSLKAGKGKSCLLKIYRDICLEEKLPVFHIEFSSKEEYDPIRLMCEIADQIGINYFDEFKSILKEIYDFPYTDRGNKKQSIPNVLKIDGIFEESQLKNIAGGDINNYNIKYPEVYYRDYRKQKMYELEKYFLKNLSSLAQKFQVVLMFDCYENLTTPAANWLQEKILNAIKEHKFINLIVVTAGKPEKTRPDYSPPYEWDNVLINLEKLTEFSENDIAEYFMKNDVPIKDGELVAYHKVCKNDPKMLASILLNYRVSNL